ncbi:hypothetical protein [Parafrankia elaeagni]|uniref:hypothetical protein n=1 Tax=Parafrankia elaeagni TaxID=222534 RepID=UPI0012B61025|nr:hypothetical protein [Parafrankia elaeagni]
MTPGRQPTVPVTSRRWLVLGVVAAGLLLGVLGLAGALATKPFAGADEAQHTAYALEVAAGRLPELDTPVRSTIPGMPGLPPDCHMPPAAARAAVDRRDAALLPACARRSGAALTNWDLVYTANHPPLFYLLEALPLGAGRALDHPLAGFYAARLLNLAVGIAAVVATAWLVRGLLPARPDLAVGAAAVLAVTGIFIAVTSQVYNDAFAVALITAATAATLALARRGPSARTLLPIALLVPAAALGRASGGLAAAVLVPAVGLAAALGTRPGPDRPGPDRTHLTRAVGAGWRRPLLAGFGASAVTGLLTIAAAGWFYARNNRLYGDPAGSERAAWMFPTGYGERPVWEIITSQDFWWTIYQGLFGRPTLLHGVPHRAIVGVGLLTVLGLLAAAIRTLLAPRTRWEPARHDRAVDVICWLTVVAEALLATATLVGYVAAGGATFTRYLLPALPLLTLAVVAGCSALPLARRGLPTFAVVLVLGGTVLTMLGRELARRDPFLDGRSPFDQLHGALDVTAVGAGRAPLVLAVLIALGVLGVALLGLSLWKLSVETVPRWRWRWRPVSVSAVDTEVADGDQLVGESYRET